MLVKRLTLLLILVLTSITIPVRAAGAGPQRLSGSFSVGGQFYESVPLLVGLIDASPYFGDSPVTLPPKERQYLGRYRGTADDGSYTLELPAVPAAQPFDVTTGKTASAGNLYIFDVRLMSDVASRGYMVENEDMIASSLMQTIDYQIAGGTLVVWAADSSQQFPTGLGPDGDLFTADDPREPLPAGWTLVNIQSFALNREVAPDLDLIATGIAETVNYTRLSCDELIPAFLDRVQSVYPFSDLYHIDWDALRARLIPASRTVKSQADCERLIREFGNTIPDGHVNYALPALRDEWAGSMGIQFTQLSDGRFAAARLTASGPAARAGIKAGAIISHIDGQPISDVLPQVILQNSNASTPHALTARRLQMLNRGPLGSKVAVTFQNPGAAPQTVTLTRAQPQQLRPEPGPAVRDHKLSSGIGYLHLSGFTDMREFRAFEAALTQLIEEDVPGIIIDVRSNPGGLSQMSDAIASRFFEQPFLIGTTLSPDGRKVYLSQVEPRAPIYMGRVAVLVDLNTASAGDLFAYTFKVSKRGIIVGHTPSAGMAGAVGGGQYALPNGGFIQVPTSGFVDADGQTAIEGVGVAPDILVPVTVESIISAQDEVLLAAEAALLAG